MKSLSSTLALGTALILLLAGCASSPGADQAPTETGGSPDATTSGDASAGGVDAGGTAEGNSGGLAGSGGSAEEITADAIADFVANTTWSFSRNGLTDDTVVTITDSVGTGSGGETYSLGNWVEGDANGDGIPDIAIPIEELAGNGFHQLWYIWLGTAGGDAIAEQVPYPIGVSNRCGHVVNSITASAQGFTVDETLRTVHDQALDCATAGSGHQIREIAVSELDGAWFPLQIAPSPAWGGFCPPSLWPDSDAMTSGMELLSAPTASAPVSASASEEIVLFPVADGSRFDAMGYEIVGYRSSVTGEVDASDMTPLLNCAFNRR